MRIPAPGGAIVRQTPSPPRKSPTPTYHPFAACTRARNTPAAGAKIHIAKTDTKNILNRSMLSMLAPSYLREHVDQERDQTSQESAHGCAQRDVLERSPRFWRSAPDQADDASDDGHSRSQLSEEIRERRDCDDSVEHTADAERPCVTWESQMCQLCDKRATIS